MARIIIEVTEKTKAIIKNMADKAKPKTSIKAVVLNALGLKDE